MASPRSWLHCLFHFSELERGDTTPRMEASCAPVLDHDTSVIHAFQFAQSSVSPLNGDDEDLLTYPAIGYLLFGHNRPPCSRGVSLHLLPLHSLALPLRSHPRCPGGWIDARSCIRTSEELPKIPRRRTSQNSVKTKFNLAEFTFHALR